MPAAAANSSKLPRRRLVGILGISQADGQVGDLAGRPVRPAVELPVQDETHADPGAHPQVHEALDVLPVPAGALADRREVHVVLEAEVRPELAAKRLHQALTAPAGQVRGQSHGAPLGVQHAGAPDGRLRHLAPAEACLAGQAVRDLADLADQRRSAADAGPLVATRHDGPGDVGDGGADVLATDVDPDDPAGLGVQLVEDRAGAFPARRAADLADQPGARELGER